MHFWVIYKDIIFHIYQISCILIVSRQFRESLFDLECFDFVFLFKIWLGRTQAFLGIITSKAISSLFLQPMWSSLHSQNFTITGLYFFIMIHGQMHKHSKKKWSNNYHYEKLVLCLCWTAPIGANKWIHLRQGYFNHSKMLKTFKPLYIFPYSSKWINVFFSVLFWNNTFLSQSYP